MDANYETKSRGGCLTAWIIFALLATALSALSYLLATGTMADTYDTGEGLFYVLGILAILQFVGAVGIFMWKKWGVYLYVGLAILSIPINLYLGVILQGLGGFVVGMLIFYYVIKDKWQFFE